MDFKDFKKQAKSVIESEIIKDVVGTPKRNYDTRFWKFQTKDNKGQSILRFLPNKNPNKAPIQAMYTHYIRHNGKLFIIPCSKAWDEYCPICKYASSHYESDYETYRKFKTTKRYISNVIVIKDSDVAEYENEDDKPTLNDVKLFSYGESIKNKLWELSSKADSNDEFSDSFKIFDFFEANVFNLVGKPKGEYINYDSSTASTKTYEIPENIQEEIFNKMFNLEEIVKKDYKTKEELQAELEKILLDDNIETYKPTKTESKKSKENYDIVEDITDDGDDADDDEMYDDIDALLS